MTDGAASHPGSSAFPPARLARVREAEVREAVRILGHGERTHPLSLPDGATPTPGLPGFDAASERLGALLTDLAPQTVVVPWRRDPHPDHVATWHLAHACRDAVWRWLEVPVCAWHRGDGAAPRTDEATPWRLDVSSVRDVKARAVAAHVSQTTGLISDSPDGFVLTPDLLAPFERPWELYLDPTDA